MRPCASSCTNEKIGERGDLSILFPSYLIADSYHLPNGRRESNYFLKTDKSKAMRGSGISSGTFDIDRKIIHKSIEVVPFVSRL